VGQECLSQTVDERIAEHLGESRMSDSFLRTVLAILRSQLSTRKIVVEAGKERKGKI
jgi:hypothetical protein